MGVNTQRYIRKPLYVDAVQITAENFDEVAAWCQGTVETEDQGPHRGEKFIRVRVQHPKSPRQTQAFVDDWILYTDRGYKVYTNKAFTLSFDKVVSGSKEASEDRKTHSTAKAKTKRERHRQKRRRSEPKPQKNHGGARIEIPELDTSPPEPESPEMQQARETIEAEGGTIEPATPEAVARAVEEDAKARAATELAEERIAELVEEDSPTAPPAPVPDISEGKMVLSEQEQEQMGPEKVRVLISSGQAILAQDLVIP